MPQPIIKKPRAKRGPIYDVYRDLSKDKVEYRWRLQAPNNEIICDSAEGYTTKRACLAGYRTMVRYAALAQLNDISSGLR